MRAITEDGMSPILIWDRYVEPVSNDVLEDLKKIARLRFVNNPIAVMPDAHKGYTAPIGSVIPTKGAIAPALMGVDIGCGILACRTNTRSDLLPDNLDSLLYNIEISVPTGRSNNGRSGDVGSWNDGSIPERVLLDWNVNLRADYKSMCKKHKWIDRNRSIEHLGTLGSGDHFIEICEEEKTGLLWILVHTGSRGPGARIGQYFLMKAKELMDEFHIELEDPNLAFIPRSNRLFPDYYSSVVFAYEFANRNRQQIASAICREIGREVGFTSSATVVSNCMHNFIEWGDSEFITRKGACSIYPGQFAVIHSNMGALDRSYVVKWAGDQGSKSYHSCSHGAGRVMSRKEARDRFNEADMEEQIGDVVYNTKKDLIDESPECYKDVDAVIKSHENMISITNTLKTILVVKGDKSG